MNLPLFTIIVFISLIVSVAAFAWGLLTGQFTHSDRARYLPFAGEETNGLAPPPEHTQTPLEVYILAAIVFTGLIIFATLVLLTAYHLLTR